MARMLDDGLLKWNNLVEARMVALKMNKLENNL